MIIKFLQMTLQTLFGTIVLTCGMPGADMNNDLLTEPARVVCVAESQASIFMFAGQVFELEEYYEDELFKSLGEGL